MLLWFRNDLRIEDNPALLYALQHQATTAIYFTTPKQWQQHDISPIKVDFTLRHVQHLAIELQRFGINLVVKEVEDFQQLQDYLLSFCHHYGFKDVVANAELELNERKRDQQLIEGGLSLKLFESDVIVSKGEILNKDGQMYKVFTPFKKAWLSYVIKHGYQCIDDHALAPFDSQQKDINLEEKQAIKTGFPRVSSANWPLADVYCQEQLPAFLDGTIHRYHLDRDIPGIDGTSSLSPYLAIGAISVRDVFRRLLLKNPSLLVEPDNEANKGAMTWLNELIWREFYRHLLFHHEKLCRHQPFIEKYVQWQWPNDKQLIEAWQQGKTGYPIVDAAMRQLTTTGWMHNRLRMIVASFLTKHLLVDWRIGERFFSEHLIDLDLAANNGGWQWAASTGCDAQPYFRIFNPITQSEKFDPQGNFIRKFLPELRDIPVKEIHFPHNYIKRHQLNVYWPAIVEHKVAREQALSFYKV
ncbi:deoxyribodipyrimidine photo-lyase [Thalassotalea ganghwensis]